MRAFDWRRIATDPVCHFDDHPLGPSNGLGNARLFGDDPWTEKVDAVCIKQSVEPLDLLLGVGLLDHLLRGGEILVAAHRAEELLDLPTGLIDVDDSHRTAGRGGPGMGGVARDKKALTGGHTHPLSAYLEPALPVYDVNPLILVAVTMAGAAAAASELEDAERAARVL